MQNTLEEVNLYIQFFSHSLTIMNIVFNDKSSQTFSGRGITQFQIREITIREISATTFLPPDEIDEDSGFGEATHEEIAEFFNFFNGNDSYFLFLYV